MFSFNSVPVKESKQAEPAVFWPCFSNASLSISHPPIQIFPFFPFSRPQKGIAATRPPRSTLFNYRPPQVTIRVSCQMQSLQQKAAQWSGVDTADAFAIDETNLFQKLGLQTFINLSTDFYTRVYDDEEDWFRSIFANSKKEEAIQNQYEFFVQRMGGPPLYTQRKGHPALIGRHRPFPVTHQAAERWLYHMQNALDNAADIDPDSKTKMMNFFRHTAFFLVAGDELKQQRQEVPCKHSSGKPASG